MHNLLTKTIPTLLLNDERQKIFSDCYVKIGLERPYLLHSMMALSALHLFAQDPSRKKLVSTASAHQGAALREAQPVISRMTEDDSIGIFAFSGFTALDTLADLTLHASGGEKARDLIEDMLSFFHLSRGIKTVIAPFYPFLSTSWAAPTLKYSDDRHLIYPTIDRDYGLPRRVVRDVIEMETQQENRRACNLANDRLFEYIAVLAIHRQEDDGVRLIQTWPVEIEKECLDMLAARRPVALIILAHYAVLMGMRPGVWWMSGLPRTLLHCIESMLGAMWSDALAWPREMIINRTVNSEDKTRLRRSKGGIVDQEVSTRVAPTD